MSDILQQIVANKVKEVEAQKLLRPKEELKSLCQSLPTIQRSARAALERSSSGIIAEFKRRSPSKGWIHQEADATHVVEGYEREGAAVCSILTDEFYFGGTLHDLQTARQRVDIPLLRKDFIIDPYQLYEAKASGADVVLLIAACLSKEQCALLAQQAHRLGLEVLLEVHREEELEYITQEVDLLGINNRHLGTFHTTVETSFQLSEAAKQVVQSFKRPPLLVSESGLTDHTVVARLRKAGFKGFLMGESFMKATDPAAALGLFLSKLNHTTSLPDSLVVKVCGMCNDTNVEAVEQLPIELMGFIFHPGSPRYVGNTVPVTKNRQIKRVGVFVNATVEHMVIQAWKYGLDFVQLHGHETATDCDVLKQQGVGVIKAIAVESADDLQQASLYHGHVDLLLFDTRCSGHGGSGRRFNWSLLSSYHGPTPFLLSGGIGPDAINDLSEFNHPFLQGIDLNSGFESAPGFKEVELLTQFLSRLSAKKNM